MNQDNDRKINGVEKENVWFQDPKLIHNNIEYSRDKILKEFVKNPKNEKLSIIKAYEDIFKTNEWINEYNYMLDVYYALLQEFLNGKGTPAGWKDLFSKYSIANEMKNRQLIEMLSKCGVNGQKPKDSEIEFILIKIQQTENSMRQTNYIS